MNFESMNIWCWLIPALVGIICGILGYLIGKGNTKIIENSAELKGLRTTNSQLKADLEACKKSVEASTNAPKTTTANLGANAIAKATQTTKTDETAKAKGTTTVKSPKAKASKPKAASTAKKTTISSSTSSLAAGAAAVKLAFDAAAAKAVYGKTIKQDDLKIVEGIGPKIEGMFKDGGIKTWKKLSESSVADCQKILDTGGKRYQIHNPESWPLQAKMCYEGKWEALKKWQDEHKHGKL